MHMFCFQCQEFGEGKGCTQVGCCGKSDECANLQDLLIYSLKGLGIVWDTLLSAGVPLDRSVGTFAAKCLFSTITNTNFDPARVLALCREVVALRRAALARHADLLAPLRALPHVAWDPADDAAYVRQSHEVGVFDTRDEDLRSLRETITYALKGLSAYTYHANILGHFDDTIPAFTFRTLAEVTRERSVEELFSLALETGRTNLAAMALLDTANAAVYGEPGPADVNLGVRGNPGILVTGHDLKDIDDLLEQSAGTGVDIYTHSEMIAAHYYPRLRRHPHLAGNYGDAWWRQESDFAAFNGPILVTSNCITPVQEAYARRIFTAGPAAYPGVPHIHRDEKGRIDFGPLVALARTCPPPTPLESGSFPGGYGWRAVTARAGKILELVKAGRIRRFVVIAGCDGRDPARIYYREVAGQLPADTIILTAGCAKYPFMRLPLGAIDGIPRILEAGQCNDCYSLVRIAQALAEAVGAESVNDLPLSFDVAWYDQKAVAVLLTLLALGVRNIRLGPSLPGFLSPAVRDRLAQTFNLMRIDTAGADVAAMLSGR